ncbi:MAG: hypothetical protein EYC69_12070 [Bacteroidetes bacterium]|nr:MAG: hypothetical protein EYC69_12070 [Bacteroidota bacterium]
MDIKKFSFIKDEPILSGKPGYFDFYHKSFSPALKDMILSDTCPHTIGLFSKWGTGKSSIVDQLKIDLEAEKDNHLFLFDAWKYQDDSLRRTFLIKLVRFLRDKEYKLPENILDSVYANRQTSRSVQSPIQSEHKRNNPKSVKDWWKKYKLIILLLLVPFVLGVVFYSLNELFPENIILFSINSVLTYVNGIAWLGLLAALFLKPIAEKMIKHATEKMFESSRTFSEVKTEIVLEERLNSPEQFESVFAKLVSEIKIGKLVIVFDNIDRVQGETAIKILSTIKTFLDIGKSNVIFIVPCDSNAINMQIRSYYKNLQADSEFDESEYLKKLFNIVIFTPEFIEEDLYQYASSLFELTGSDIKKITDDQKVLSVITKAFKKNPRELKQFINNFISAILVASKTDVADEILSKDNIGYFAKVVILKQKFPRAYLRLKEFWNEPEKILMTDEKDLELRDFLTLTSSVSTDNVEPFIYFKKPFIELGLKNAAEIRKVLLSGSIDEFAKFSTEEPDKRKLERYIVTILRNYKSQNRVLFTIFKTQIQGLDNSGLIENCTEDYFEVSVDVIENLWNNYFDLPIITIFKLVPKLTPSDRNVIFNLYSSVLLNDEIKTEARKPYLLILLEQLSANLDLLNSEHIERINSALRINLEGQHDLLNKFQTIEKQRAFIDSEILKKIVHETLTNRNVSKYFPILINYREFLIELKLDLTLVQKVASLVHSQNNETPHTAAEKIQFFDNLNNFIGEYINSFEELPETDQADLLNGLNNSLHQSSVNDDLYFIIIISIEWLITSLSSKHQVDQMHSIIGNFILNSNIANFEKYFNYWNEDTQQEILEREFDTLSNKFVIDDGFLEACYKIGTLGQQLRVISKLIEKKHDYGIAFLKSLEEDLPDRGKVLQLLVDRCKTLSLVERQDILNYLKEKVLESDDDQIKKNINDSILEYLKSNDANQILFGTSLLELTFINDTNHRDITKEMLDFYGAKDYRLGEVDIPVIDYFIQIVTKLPRALKEKLVYLLFTNIKIDQSNILIKSMFDSIAKLKLNSDEFESDYTDLMQRIKQWPEVENKKQVINYFEMALNNSQGKLSNKYLEEIKKTDTETSA